MKSEKPYFNFPIQLLKGFMLNPDKCLYDIFCFAHYALCLEYKSFTGIIPLEEKMESAGRLYGTSFDNAEDVYEKGEDLYLMFNSKSPKAGIRIEVWNQYYEVQKTDFELACLLGFFAMKSIIGPNKFCKTNNLFWMSRMNGNVKTVSNVDELSPQIRFYFKRYQRDKIIRELQDNWGLKYYGTHMRGFYASFDLAKDELVFRALKRRKKILEKQRKIEELAALRMANRRLGLNH